MLNHKVVTHSQGKTWEQMGGFVLEDLERSFGLKEQVEPNQGSINK